MKKVFLVLSVVFLLSSCRVTYHHSSRSNEVREVLGVTTAGDTIQVPIDYFGDRLNRQYDFNLQYFFWRDNWWLYNNPSLYNRSWFYRNYWWNPYTPPIIIQNPRPRYSQPQPRRWRTRTNIQQRRNEVKPQPNRGRSNQQTRKPQYVRPNTRSRVTTPPPTHSNRNSTVRRSNTNTRTKNN